MGGHLKEKHYQEVALKAEKLGLLPFLVLINALGYTHLEQNLGAKLTEKL